jgi:hypothetical protein
MHDVLMMCVGSDVARVLIGTRATNSTAYALAMPALAALADLSRIDLVRVEVACVHLTGTSRRPAALLGRVSLEYVVRCSMSV